ncbi:hypothetical protein [Myxococcus faecalis]|uniref:hypothetical protein n=1 Tax=Myxococcus faecalis TaxID=3115646 RepID=UPI003CF64138
MPLPREATSDDAALLARLLRESFEEYRGRLEPPSSAHGKTEAAVRRELKDHHVWYGRLGYQLLSQGTHPGFPAPTFLVLEKHLWVE